MVINNDQLFPKILGSTALIIAMVAATFSIFGIGTLFSGAATSVIIMASALEMG